MSKQEKKNKHRYEELQANIYTVNAGMKIIKDVKIIRIKSDDYNLLIMKDYMPILGDIDGEISFQTDDDNISYDKVKAFYMLKDNEFNLIIRQES